MPINPFNPERSATYQDPESYQSEVEVPSLPDRPIEIIKKEVLPTLGRIEKLLEKIAGVKVVLRVLEQTLAPGEQVTFTMDVGRFDSWCIYNFTTTGGFMRVGPNSVSVSPVGSLYVGENGKVIFPAQTNQTTVLNDSGVNVTVFAVAFNTGFDIWF